MIETLENLKSRKIQFTIEQVVTILLFIVFGIYLFMQHRIIGMYYDDFGNASLSYAYDAGIEGTDYSFIDLAKWAKYIYFNWGGRIIYALMLIPLLKNGIHIFMILQAVIIFLMLIVMYQLIEKYYNGKNWVIIFSFMLVYGILQGDLLTQGIYWASASVLYVWPMLPFMLLLWVYKETEARVKMGEAIRVSEYVKVFLLVPFVTLSQEQLGGALIVWIIFHIWINHGKKEKNYLKLDIFLLSWSVITYLIMFLAPGNWARLSTNTDYVHQLFVEKMWFGISNVLTLLTNQYLRCFNLLLWLMGVLMIISLRKKSKKWHLVLFGVAMLPFGAVVMSAILKMSIFSDSIRNISFLIFLIDMLFLCISYFKMIERLEFVAVMLAAVASVFCLIVSPAFSLRSCIPYVFICMIFVAVVVSNTVKECIEKKALAAVGVIAACLGMVCLMNVKEIYKGYEENYYADNYNFEKLKDYNGTDNKIYLLQYSNAMYRGTMSCDKGFEYIDYWIKEYFAIPQSVIIEWKSMTELFDYAKAAAIDMEYADGFYEDEGGYRWGSDRAKAVINNLQGEERHVRLKVKIATGFEEKAKIVVLCNGDEVYQIEANNHGTDCDMDLILRPGENIIEFITDAEKINTGNDIRNLYMNFSNLNCEMVY